MATIYHVTQEWDGSDLLSLAGRIDAGELDLDESLAAIAAKWCLGDLRKAEEYLDGDGRYVHCHGSLVEAIGYQDEWCEDGMILAIDAGDLEVETGTEYPHPVVRDRVPAGLVTVLEAE